MAEWQPAQGYAKAWAHANIALLKYWGKAGPGNAPATPSISLTLEALTTQTEVERCDGPGDTAELDGQPASGEALARIVQYLGLWRERGLLGGRFHVRSRNNFPTAAGLASSASGFAALATALSAFAARELPPAELSRLARLGSGSAARSVHGGLVALPSGPDPAALLLLPNYAIPWGVVICIVDAPPKEMSSRAGMELSRQTSPNYAAWLQQAAGDYQELLTLLGVGPDGKPPRLLPEASLLGAAGPLIEANCLAMHACMLSTQPPLAYWSAATQDVMAAVRRWREDGLPVYFTVDAGAHVFLICEQARLAQVALLAAELSSVQQAIVSPPGGPAVILERR